MATVEVPDTKKQTEGRTNVHGAFPLKLHFMLGEIEADGGEGIVSWAPHGRCFRVHKPDEFVNKFLGRYVGFEHRRSSLIRWQSNVYVANTLSSVALFASAGSISRSIHRFSAS
jgi:HSF-type DNA-binding